MATDSSFVSKPPRGWLHPDTLIAKEGVSYTVRYIGCLEVFTSMKKLDFETRSQVAKECINRVCEAAGVKSADKKRRVDPVVGRALAEKPILTHSGANVTLTVSSKMLTVTALQGGELITRHEMPQISFASGGDAETLDFVAYVGKDVQEWRACFVLECGGRLAHEVISTIGQAFELRFKEFLTKPSSINLNSISNTEEHEYYNDMPDKLPPMSGIRPPPLVSLGSNDGAVEGHSGSRPPPLTSLGSYNHEGASSSNGFEERHYVNQTPPPRTPPTALLPPTIDIFDMQPFTAGDSSIPEPLMVSQNSAAVTTPAGSQAELLAQEIWFHGNISRQIAEQLVEEEGDFLVRSSGGCAGQYVLTGVRKGQRKHLLLIDPHGVVRTKDRVFTSVPHLISYHWSKALPIVSADSSLLLKNPIPRQK